MAVPPRFAVKFLCAVTNSVASESILTEDAMFSLAIGILFVFHGPVSHDDHVTVVDAQIISEQIRSARYQAIQNRLQIEGPCGRVSCT